jgi:hypothetical protein
MRCPFSPLLPLSLILLGGLFLVATFGISIQDVFHSIAAALTR